VSDMNEFVLRIDQRIEYLECDGHGNSARDVAAFRDAAVAEITRLRAEVAQRTAERDEALLRWQRLYNEIDCRVEHGANSNGHLEAIRKMMQKEANP
jgi:RNA 3'-terminal phosphate cyclase